MFSLRHTKFTKALTLIVSALFVLQMVWPALLAPRAANAIGDAVDKAATAATAAATGMLAGIEAEETTATKVEKVEDTIMDKLFKSLVLTAAMTVKNVLIKMARKAAEQSVTYMATGGWGEGAMFYDQAWEGWKQDMKDQAIGQFLDSMSELLGYDICSPSIPFELDIKISLQFRYADVGYEQVKKPDCTLSKLTANWTAFAEGIRAKYKDVLKQMQDPSAESLAMLQETFDVAFTPSKSGVGVYLTAEAKMIKERNKKVEGAEKQREEDQGGKSVISITGDLIKTPAWLTRAHSEQELEKAKETTTDEIKMAENVMTEIPAAVGMAFLNTFASEFWQQMIIDKYFKKGLADGTKAYNPEQKLFEKKQSLSSELALAKINFSFSQKQVDLLSEFETCQENRQINNCVIDKAFAEAVRNASQDKPLTVAQALELGLIDGNKPLINPDDDRHKSDDCYEVGFCYSNLVKLRKARIIPIGWEIAALQVKPGSGITLKNVVDNFNSCDLIGPASSNFCHLIDPGWALRYPAAQCKALVNGPLLVAAGTTDRAEYCADLQSCIRMNDQGKCETFGYCAAEKNIFRFGGTECNGAYDSCRVLKNAKGKEAAYLVNTVDREFCDYGAAGCAWYSTLKNKSADWQWSTDAGSRIYLNKKIYDMECKPGEEGCTRMVRTEAGLGTNLLANSGFEQQTATETEIVVGPVAVPGWQNTNTVFKEGYDGNYSVQVDTSLKSNGIYFLPKFYTRYFAVSAYVKKQSGAPTMVLALSNATENQVLLALAPIFTDLLPVINQADAGKVITGEWTKVYKIIQMTPASVVNATGGGTMNLEITVANGGVLVDQVMLEEIDSPFPDAMHAYNEYAAQNITYLKKAPTYLACYNTTAEGNYLDGRPRVKTDIAEADDAKSADAFKGCDKFARLCTASEVGCDAYKPADKGSTMYGVSSYSDFCPQECAGYESYAQSPTFFELGAFPLYFIPKTGAKCSSSEAGCEEFTNLDELAKGGEAKEYYIEPKLCAKLPDSAAECESYYTWQSKEVTGYKLQSYVLQKGKEGAPKLVYDAYKDDCSVDIYLAKNNPDCRQFFNKAGDAFYSLASKTITCSTDCHPYRRTLLFDSEKLCMDRQGAWKNGECISLIIPGEGKKCGAANAGCREYKGNQSGVERVLENYTFSPKDNAGNTLDELNYSNGSMAITTVEFGPVLSVKKDANEASVFTNADKVGLAADEYRLSFWIKKNGPDGNFKVELRDGSIVEYTLGEAALPITDWQQFSYQIKPEQLDKPLSVGISATVGFFLDNFKIVRVTEYEYLIKKSWVTPKACDYKLNSDLSVSDNSLPQAMLGCREFTDKDNVKNYLKSFSGLCSPDKVGCEAVIDTQNNVWPVAKDYKVEVSMERLCYEFARDWHDVNQPAAGHYKISNDKCVIPVKKTNTSGNEVVGDYVAGTKQDLCVDDYSWETDKCFEIQASVPADRLVYLVINKSALCDGGAKGCMALGLPALTVDKTGKEKVKIDAKKSDAEIWSNQFYKLDPDLAEGQALNNPLCSRSESGCREYQDAQGAKSYFRDPGDKVCEYRKVAKGADMEYGWYAKKVDRDGSGALNGDETKDTECAAEDYFNTGLKSLIMNSDFDDSSSADGVDTYAGWTAACPKKEDKCTAFIDPTDIAKSFRGRPYYFIDNDQIDRTCGAVNRKEGCALFFDTSAGAAYGGALDPASAGANYWAFETYIKANDAAKAVTPVQTGDPIIGADTCVPVLGVKTCPLSTPTGLSLVTDAKLESLKGADVDSLCKNFDYCQFMADCIAKENDVNACYKRVEDTDLLPSTTAKEFNCANMDVGDTPEQNAASLTSLSGAITNAYCTVKKIMKLNANTMIRVIQDRDCAEWYACQSSHWDWNPSTSKYVEACDRVGLCDKLDPGKESAKCQHEVKEVDDENLLSKNETIVSNYAGRSTGWYAYDYSGYAVPQIAPIQFYNAADVNQSANIMTCGGWPSVATCTKDMDCVCTKDDLDCLTIGNETCEVVKDYRLVNQSALACKTDDNCINGITGVNIAAYTEYCGDSATQDNCRCLNGVCVRPFVPGTNFADSKEPACRAYPEKASPFPAAVKDTQPYAGVNVMFDGQSKGDLDFACRYRKVTYGGKAITKYFPKDSRYTPSLPGGVCQDEPETPCGCDVDPLINSKTMCSSSLTDCGGTADNPGTCSKRDGKMGEYAGWQGYCLEDDKSFSLYNETDQHPCLTWYPSHGLAGLMDTNNDYAAAGFNVEAYDFDDNIYYCQHAARWEYRKAFTVYSSGNNKDKWRDCQGGQDERALMVKKSALKQKYQDILDPGTNQCNVGQFILYKEDGTVVENPGGTCEDYSADYVVLKNSGSDSNTACLIEDADPSKAIGCMVQSCEMTCDSEIGNLVMPQSEKYCPYGYKATNLYHIEHHKEWWSCDHDADSFRFAFECTPIGPDGVLVEEGWFYDPDGTSASITFAIAEASNTGENTQVYTEKEAWSCGQVHGVTDGNQSKSYTNVIYQGKAISSQSGEFVEDDDAAAIKKGAQCNKEPNGLYGALAYSGKVDKKQFNMFVDKKDKPLLACNDDAGYWSGGAESLGSALSKIYSRSYSYFNHKLNTDWPSGICVSDHDRVSGKPCVKTLECVASGEATQIKCTGLPLGTCSDASPNASLVNEYCYTDKDCGGEGLAFEFENGLTMQYCSIYPYAMIEIIFGNTKKCPLDGKYEKKIPDPADIDYACRKYFWLDGSGETCIKDESSKIGPVTGNSIPEGTYCTADADPYIYKPSNTVTPASYFENSTGQLWDDSWRDTIAHPPTIAGVESVGTTDSKGKPQYTALPHQLTVSTPAMTKSFGPIVGEGGQLEVTLKFYAWAHDDQMPLTKVKVYWGRGYTSGSDSAKFQNHKPRCQRTAGEKLRHCIYYKNQDKSIYIGSGLVCDVTSLDPLQCKAFDIGFDVICGSMLPSGDDNFGDTAEKSNPKANACLEGYFSFSNTYTCSAAELALMDPCLVPGAGGEQACKEQINDRWACRYRPAVQVMDNWEWCNAEHDGEGGEVVDVKDGTMKAEKGYYGMICSEKSTEINNKEYYDGFIYVIP